MENRPIIVAHRGASKNAPENTLAAFTLAWIQGADAIELDVRRTKDGQLVCMHDETTGRTCSKDLTVAKSTYNQLIELDAGKKFGDSWRGQKIPLLSEVLRALPPGKKAIVEIKDNAESVPLLKALLESEPPISPEQVWIASFDIEVVMQCRTMLPQFKTLMLCDRKKSFLRGVWQPEREFLLRVLETSGASGLYCGAGGLVHDAELAKAVLATGRDVHAWAVSLPGQAQKLASQGVASITTDKPGWLRSALEARLAPQPAKKGTPGRPKRVR